MFTWYHIQCQEVFTVLVGNSHSIFSNGLTYIGGDNISWCEKLKYLGIMFKSGKHLMCEFDLCIRRFYTAAKSIYDNNRFASEMSKLQLIESFCLPSCFLMDVKYCILVHSNLVNCMLAGIMPTEKMFKMNQWESVKLLQWFCGRLDFKHILVQRKLIFLDVFWS